MPPPGGKDKAAEERFANFMTSTAGGTQGSSSYSGGTGQSGGPGGMTFGEAADAGIMSQQDAVVAQAQQNFQNQQNQQNQQDTSDTSGTSGTTPKDEEKTLSTLISNAFFGKPLNQLDRLELQFAQRMLSDYQKLDEKNPLKLFALMQRDRANMFGEKLGKDIQDEFTTMDGELVDPDKVKNLNIGGIETLVDEDGNPVRRSRSGVGDMLEETLGESIEERLKKFAPDIFYGTGYGTMPATTGGLVNLADNAALKTNPDGEGYITSDGRIISEEQGKTYNNMIFAARAELDRMGKNPFTGNPQGGGQTGGGGIPSVTPPTDPTDPTDPIDKNPMLPFKPPSTPSTLPTSDPLVTDYAQLGLPQIYGNQQMPNYANFYQPQPNLQSYLENLKKRFGIG